MSLKLADRVANLGTYLFVASSSIKQKALDRKKPLIDLSVGDPDVSISSDLLKEAFDFALNLSHARLYPPNRGRLSLKRAIADWMRFRFGVSLDPNKEIGVLAGSKEGLAHLIMTLCNPGDRVLMGSLSYPVYRRASQIAGAKVDFLPMEESDNFLVDFNRVKGSSQKTLIINYPNNPTGATASLDYLSVLVSWARESNCFIVSDCAYSEIYDDAGEAPQSILEAPGAKDCAVEFHSFSKSFGLAGLRLGWVCGNPQVLEGLYCLKDTYDSGVSNFSQAVGEAILRSSGRDRELSRIRKSYIYRRRIFEKGLKTSRIKFFPASATFYVWAKEPRMRFVEELLAKAHILAVSGSGFGREGENWMRFALCQEEKILKEALGRWGQVSHFPPIKRLGKQIE